jgi:hypothetical protein
LAEAFCSRKAIFKKSDAASPKALTLVQIIQIAQPLDSIQNVFEESLV